MVDLPFVFALNDLGHVVVDFVEKIPPAFRIASGLPYAPAVGFPREALEQACQRRGISRRPDGTDTISVSVHLVPWEYESVPDEEVTPRREAHRRFVTYVRTAAKLVDLGFGLHSVDGDQLFWCFPGTGPRYDLLNMQQAEELHEEGALFEWRVAGMPLPGTEIQSARWYLWGCLLTVEVGPPF